MILLAIAAHAMAQKLIWADEFDTPGHPDDRKWGYEVGYIRNHQSQFYTDRRLENARVEDGHLIIQSRKESYQGYNYTSASLNTFGKFTFTGDFRVDVSAKLPDGLGMWPAIWMMGVNIPSVGWPKCSELDIMEYVGHTPNTIYSTFHWFSNAAQGHQSKGVNFQSQTLHSQFHLYSLQRVGSTMRVYFDQKEVMQFETPKDSPQCSFVCPLYLLINTAVGGDWGGKINDSIFPQQFVFDYVRVYSVSAAQLPE